MELQCVFYSVLYSTNCTLVIFNHINGKHIHIYNFSLQTVTLTWWSLFRDSTYYILSVLTLIMVRWAFHQNNPSVSHLCEAFTLPHCALKNPLCSLSRLYMMPELSGESMYLELCLYFLAVLPWINVDVGFAWSPAWNKLLHGFHG